MEYLAVLWSRYLVHIFDVLIVGFIFYQALLLIRGTRAVQIVVGIVIVGVITLLSQLLGFPALNWLLQKFWIAGVVLLAVVFQPEIRSALARLGARTAGRFVITEEMDVVNEIVATVKEAARRQMGILLVIERDTGLKNYLESGTSVNGKVTRELLLTIFQPPSVLHDGGVIIQGNRVAGAGCIFPVSQDPSLSKWLGTRHRAAVGITEVSDAYAICVSEETGNVSVAEEGKLTTRVDPDELRERLMNLFQSSKKPKDVKPEVSVE
jgi:diadenylate cyclase